MKKRFIIAGILLLTTTATFATEGINLIGLGPVQKGTAGAGVAAAKDSTWLLLNPAGLTKIPRSVDASFEIFAPERDIRSSTNPGAGTQHDDNIFFVPSLSASLGCCGSTNAYLGIGLFGTSGMGVWYDEPRIAAIAGRDRHSELQVAKIILAFAYDLGNGWSVGAGPVLAISRMRTDMFNGTAPGSDDWDTAYGGGAVFGVQKSWNRCSIGASYLTEQWMSEFDEYSVLMPDSLNLPPQFQIGFAVDALTNLEVAVDYRFIHWERVGMWSSTPPGGFGWEDQHIGKIGITWKATGRLTLRSGLSHGNSPINDEDVFANALFPAIVKTHLAGGFSYAITEKLDLHATFMHAFKQKFTDDGSTMGGIGTGTSIHLAEDTLTLGLGYQF